MISVVAEGLWNRLEKAEKAASRYADIKWEERNPAYRMEDAFVFAHDAAEEAARTVLESVPLGETVEMPQHVWDYWVATLRAYNTSMPTGVRDGKRWCNITSKGVKRILEYKKPFPTANYCITIERIVTIKES